MAGLVEQSLWSSEGNPGSSVPPRDGHGAPKLGGRAVVIGAGMGGLAAAGALAKYFERVDILERDRLTASVGSRSGTPQDRHPHGLLAGGLRALDQIFPGFKRDLAAAGAVPVAVAQDMQFERPDVGVLPKRDFGIVVQVLSVSSASQMGLRCLRGADSGHSNAGGLTGQIDPNPTFMTAPPGERLRRKADDRIPCDCAAMRVRPSCAEHGLEVRIWHRVTNPGKAALLLHLAGALHEGG